MHSTHRALCLLLSFSLLLLLSACGAHTEAVPVSRSESDAEPSLFSSEAQLTVSTVSEAPETSPSTESEAPEGTDAPAESEPETAPSTAPEPSAEAPSAPVETKAPQPEATSPTAEPGTSTEPPQPESQEAEETSTVSAEPFVYRGLVELRAIDDSFVIDQKYATSDNFTGIQQYDRTLCLVQQDIVERLITANNLAKQYGLRLKIWDAYRPISVQQALHDSAPAELAPYVPAPGPYSMHARGITVDLTLCLPDGTDLDMPTEFDDFSVAANSDYEGATETQIANRELLNEIMTAAGFKRSKLEWWHFDGPNRDNYDILDLSFAEFEQARDNNS